MAAMAFVPKRFRREEIILRAVTPVADDGLVSNVTSALARGYLELPPAGVAPVQAERLTIVANGPSALQLDLPTQGPTLALNGALKLFTDKGVAPTFWAACDPQALVADFLTDPPDETVYLVSSYCHPDVFEALKGKNVVLWHVNGFASWSLVGDRYPLLTAPSISLMSFELGERVGFRGFDIWGFDGCYGADGADHAVPQKHNRPHDITISVAGRNFASSRTWGLEGESLMNMFVDNPRDVVIHGDGLFRAQLAFVLGA